MIFSKYTFEATHDKGKFKISNVATSQDDAITNICNFENCPQRALRFIKAVEI